MTLCLKCPLEQVELTLFELCAAERRVTQRALLLSVWDQLTATQTQLKGVLVQFSYNEASPSPPIPNR